MSNDNLNQAPLGKQSDYISEYEPSLLFPITRQIKRDEINVPSLLPFYGYDTWNAFEVSWLNPKGKPQVAIAQFDIDCHSQCIIESKSFKLYLNSFNNSLFDDAHCVKATLEKDIKAAVNGKVTVRLLAVDDMSLYSFNTFNGTCLDDLDIDCTEYRVQSHYLSSDDNTLVNEQLYSHLLKSNCLVTGQPDWGSVAITYQGPQINHEGLLKYIVSFRNHNEFHEQCVERIFMDVLKHCKPTALTVNARYTRRGGLDINPVRSTETVIPATHFRMPRQ